MYDRSLPSADRATPRFPVPWDDPDALQRFLLSAVRSKIASEAAEKRSADLHLASMLITSIFCLQDSDPDSIQRVRTYAARHALEWLHGSTPEDA